MKKCIKCNEKLIQKSGESNKDYNKRKFCNYSCSSSYTSRIKFSKNKLGICENCSSEIIFNKSKSGDRYNKRKFCNKCLKNIRAKTIYNKYKINSRCFNR